MPWALSPTTFSPHLLDSKAFQHRDTLAPRPQRADVMHAPKILETSPYTFCPTVLDTMPPQQRHPLRSALLCAEGPRTPMPYANKWVMQLTARWWPDMWALHPELRAWSLRLQYLYIGTRI